MLEDVKRDTHEVTRLFPGSNSKPYEYKIWTSQLSTSYICGDNPMWSISSIWNSYRIQNTDKLSTNRIWNFLSAWVHWILHRQYLAIIMSPGFTASALRIPPVIKYIYEVKHHRVELRIRIYLLTQLTTKNTRN